MISREARAVLLRMAVIQAWMKTYESTPYLLELQEAGLIEQHPSVDYDYRLTALGRIMTNAQFPERVRYA